MPRHPAADPQDNARRVATMTKETNMQLEMSLKRSRAGFDMVRNFTMLSTLVEDENH